MAPVPDGWSSLRSGTVRKWQQSSGWIRAVRGAPLLEQHCARTRIRELRHVDRHDAIGSKVPQVLAQLAPRRDHAQPIEKSQRERPDDARGFLALEVAIADLDLA